MTTVSEALWHLMGGNIYEIPECIPGLHPSMDVDDLQEALELFRIKKNCTCGYGGQHEPSKSSCGANR